MGDLANVGGSEYSWSSTISSTNGMNLRLGVTWLYSSSADYRAYSFQLRCLSE
ncbi:hypothetical protein [uncultured Rikenella sp.]|uniref:hypothetical protein n=1 Tax=uncultured Rikenella sp. TaxID=368003 RepID=UPI00262D7BBD|nr:hypothetical protein [uncultured Rikenella sp.]